jgi:hypothetical protein
VDGGDGHVIDIQAEEDRGDHAAYAEDVFCYSRVTINGSLSVFKINLFVVVLYEINLSSVPLCFLLSCLTVLVVTKNWVCNAYQIHKRLF